MVGDIVAGAVVAVLVAILGRVLRRGRGEVGAALRREHLRGLTRRECRQVTRAVRQGRRVEDPRLAPAAVAEARAAAALGKWLETRGFRLVLAAGTVLGIAGIVKGTVTGDVVLLASGLIMLGVTAALPSLQRWRNQRTARALAANQSS